MEIPRTSCPRAEKQEPGGVAEFCVPVWSITRSRGHGMRLAGEVASLELVQGRMGWRFPKCERKDEGKPGLQEPTAAWTVLALVSHRRVGPWPCCGGIRGPKGAG